MGKLIPFGDSIQHYCVRDHEAATFGDGRSPLAVLKTSGVQQYDPIFKKWLDFDIALEMPINNPNRRIEFKNLYLRLDFLFAWKHSADKLKQEPHHLEQGESGEQDWYFCKLISQMFKKSGVCRQVTNK